MGRKPKEASSPIDAEAVNAEAEALEKANRRRQKALQKAQQLEEGQLLEPEAEAEPEIPGAAKVEELIEQLDGEAGSCEIYRLEAGQRVQMGSYDVTNLKDWKEVMDSVVRVKGGGHYLTIFRYSNGKQIGQIKRTFDPEIYKPAARETVVPNQTGEAMMVKFMEMQQAAEQRHREEIALMRQEIARTQAESQRMLLEMVKSQNQGFLKNAQELSVLKNLFSDKSDPIEQMLNLRDLMDEFKGEAKTENAPVWERLLSGLAEGLVKPKRALRDARLPTPAPVPPTHRSTTPDPGLLPGAGNATGAPAASSTAVERPILEKFIPQLLAAISSGKTPDEIAELIDQATENNATERAALIVLCTSPDWDTWASNPALAPHQEWIKKFREALNYYLTEPSGTPS